MSEEFFSMPGALPNDERRRCYLEGYQAHQEGKPLEDCPYRERRDLTAGVTNDEHQRGVEWRRGWRDASAGVDFRLSAMMLINENAVRAAAEVLKLVRHKGCDDWVMSRDHDPSMVGDLFVFNPSRGLHCMYFEAFEAVAIAEKYARELGDRDKTETVKETWMVIGGDDWDEKVIRSLIKRVREQTRDNPEGIVWPRR